MTSAGGIVALARGVARRLVREYRLYWVCAAPAATDAPPLAPGVTFRQFAVSDRAIVAGDPAPDFRKALGYEESGAAGYVLARAGGPLCIAHFVDRDGYADDAIWRLDPRDLVLVNIVTHPSARGEGLATALIAHATHAALGGRDGRAIAFIWWNHHASLAAFRRAGWRRIGFSMQIDAGPGRTARLHIPLGR